MSADVTVGDSLGTRRLLPAAVCSVLAAACAVGLLSASAYLITRAGAHTPIGDLMGLIVAVRAFALGRAGLRYLERVTSHDSAFAVLAELRIRMFAKLVPLAPDGLRRLGRGDLLSRLVSDVDEMQNLTLRVVLPLTTSLTVSAASVVAVWLVLPAAGIGLAVALLIAFVLGTFLTHVVAGSDEAALASLRAEYADAVVDLVGALDVLTAYGELPRRQRRIASLGEQLRRSAVRRSLSAGLVAGLVTLLAGGSTVLALAVGAGPVSAGTVSGPWYAVLALVPIAVFEVFAMVPLASSAWRGVRASAERLQHVVPDDRPRQIPDEDPAGTPVGEIDVASGAEISLRGVTAGWPSTPDAALRGVDLDLTPGECVLVTGESGAGKTTLAHVLVRFLDYAGSYTLSGCEAASTSPATVRRVVGLCEQAPHIFDNTLRNNLRFARDTASDDDLYDVLDAVGLTSFVVERGGLDARLGERGALLSGGQAQRLALARALLADFPVLILDEPTANVNPDLAEPLLAALLDAATASNRSVLLISHADVPARFVTRHVHMADGRIV